MSSTETEVEQVTESFAELFEASIKNFEVGGVVPGNIVSVREKDVLIDIGYKSEGILMKDEFSDHTQVFEGADVDVLLESIENEDGMIVISKKKADRIKFWDNIVNENGEGSLIVGKIFKKVKGGFMVDIGMEAFLPASLVDLRPTRNLDQFIGLEAQFKIVKINHKRRNIVLSRKDFLEGELEETRSKILEDISEGQVLKGRVKNITDFGAFIDLGGVDGLLHITDMSWGRVSHPSEMLEIGDDIEVVVINFDETTKRVSLGLKQKSDNPWEKADEKYPVNSKVSGNVVNILPYGVFIELENGIEGLVHISELSWTKKISHPSEVLAAGDVVDAIVLSVDKENRKIALGVKQTEVNPWLLVEEKYAVNSIVEGNVRNITDYGVFVELEPGIDGMIHISDISWLKKVTHPGEYFKKNEVVQAKILAIDTASRKISLGVKQLDEDPWQSLVEKYQPGEVFSGVISKVVNFGIFVTLDENIEGLVHVSEIAQKPGNLEDHYKVEEKIEVVVLKVDVDARKIALTLKSDGGGVDVAEAAPAVAEEVSAVVEAPAVEEPTVEVAEEVVVVDVAEEDEQPVIKEEAADGESTDVAADDAEETKEAE